jgi:hypothetical protein
LLGYFSDNKVNGGFETDPGLLYLFFFETTFLSIRPVFGQSWASLSTTASFVEFPPIVVITNRYWEQQLSTTLQSLVKTKLVVISWAKWEHSSSRRLGEKRNETMVYQRIDWFAGCPLYRRSLNLPENKTKQGNAKKVDEQ